MKRALLPVLIFLLGLRLEANDLVRLDNYGSWISDRSSHGVHTKHFWVDVERPSGQGELQVGIRWTTDNWQSFSEETAVFERRISERSEIWGVDVTVGSYSNYKPGPADVEFALYARTVGQEEPWIASQTYSIYRKPTIERPIRFVEAEVSYSAAQGARVDGYARALDLGPGSHLEVYYSVDGGSRFHSVAAQWSSYEKWVFAIDGLGRETLPDEVLLYLRYLDGEGGIFTVGEPGSDQPYRYRLEPEIQTQLNWQENLPLVGMAKLSGRARSEIEVARLEYRLDDGSWNELHQSGVYFDSRVLSQGEHEVQVRAELLGGYLSYDQPLVFNVGESLSPYRELTFFEGSTYYLSMRHVFASDDQRSWIAWRQYNSDGNEPRDFIEFYPNLKSEQAIWRSPEWKTEILGIAPVHTSGEVYVLSRSDYQSPLYLSRLNSNGTLDQGFAASGHLQLPASFEEFDGLCSWIPSMQMVGDQIAILDGCQDALLLFDKNGRFLQGLDFGQAYGFSWDASAQRILVDLGRGFEIYSFDEGSCADEPLFRGDYGDQSYPEIVQLRGEKIWILNGRLLQARSWHGKVESYWHFAGSTDTFGDLTGSTTQIMPFGQSEVAVWGRKLNDKVLLRLRARGD